MRIHSPTVVSSQSALFQIDMQEDILLWNHIHLMLHFPSQSGVEVFGREMQGGKRKRLQSGNLHTASFLVQ